VMDAQQVKSLTVDGEQVSIVLAQQVGQLTHQNAVQSVMLNAALAENAELREQVAELRRQLADPRAGDEGPGAVPGPDASPLPGV
jgi:hypothetical protein